MSTSDRKAATFPHSCRSPEGDTVLRRHLDEMHAKLKGELRAAPAGEKSPSPLDA